MNESPKYELTIAYRIYPKISKVPPVFADDKFKLSELCLASFAESIKDIKAKIYVILDNCPNEYTLLFEKYLNKMDYELIELPFTGNAGTFKLQCEILKNAESEFVYFAEDDYFYLPDCFNYMLQFMKETPEVSYLTPYDHLDYHNSDFHKYYQKEIQKLGKKWKQVSTTTLTFIARKSDLISDLDVFLTYTQKNYDASIWLALTKINTLNLPLFIKYILSNLPFAKIYIKMILFTPLRLIFGTRRVLVVPQVSLAQHLDELYMAPSINWNEEFKKVVDKYLI